MTVAQAFEMDTALKPSRWMRMRTDFGPWELVDGRTIRRQMADGNYLSLTAEGHYLTDRSNSWMFRDVLWCLKAIRSIVTDRGGWMLPDEPWVSCSRCDDVLYDGENHKALAAYRIKANGDAICNECDGDEASEFHASGQESL